MGGPVIRLTTIGAKTGKERPVPVFGLRDGDRWVVIASNWGREAHPAWYHNLKANPEVKVTARDQTGEYVAREATGDEREEYLNQIAELNPGLETYQKRSGERSIPVVVLSPSEKTEADGCSAVFGNQSQTTGIGRVQLTSPPFMSERSVPPRPVADSSVVARISFKSHFCFPFSIRHPGLGGGVRPGPRRDHQPELMKPLPC